MKRLFILLFALLPMLVSAQPLTPFCHKNGKWGYEGYVKGKTKAVIKPKFESARKFQGSYAFVRYKGLWGIIDKDGKFVVKPKYNYVGEQKEDYSIVKLGDRYGIIKGTQVVVPFKYDELRFFDDVNVYARCDTRSGVVALDGREIVPIKYDNIYKFGDDYFKVSLDDKYDLYSSSGRKITTTLYDDISLYANRFLKVMIGNKYGLLNLSGKQIAAVQYDSINIYERNFLKVVQNGKCGLLNVSGTSVVPVQYDDISLYKGKYLKVKQGNKLGLFSISGVSLASVEYDDISLVDNQFLKVRKGRQYGLLSVNGTSIAEVKYDAIALLDNKYISVKVDWKYGLLDLSGETLVAAEYDTIEQIAKGKYLLMSDTPCLVDTQGSIYRNLMLYTSSNGKIVEPRYSDCIDANIVLNAYYGDIGIMAFDKPITKITNGAFMYCNTLTDITIPESVTTVAGNIFKGCTSLPVEDGFRYAGTYLVERVDKTLQTYIIKPGTRFIGDDALDFSGDENNRLNMSWENRSLTAPDTIIFVGDGNHLCCIVSLNIIVTDLKKHCENPMPLIDCVAGDGDCSPVRLFNNGEKITNSIIIPDGVKKIASAAFNGSYDIKSIIIPNSVEIIEYLAFFFSCIDKIYCTSVTPPVAPYLGINLEDTELKIYVPRKSVAAYKRAAGWSRYAASIVGYDFNTTKQVPANKPRSASER